MGERGPVPKPSGQRRRRNAPERPVVSAPAKAQEKASKSGKRGDDGGAKRPPVDAKWHPIAKAWYLGLGESLQSAFYEPSDWALARLLAEVITRELAEQPLLDMSGRPVVDKKGAPVMVRRPVKGASLAAILKGMSSLLTSEGDRRRLQIELRGAPGADTEESGNVADLGAWRARTDGTG